MSDLPPSQPVNSYTQQTGMTPAQMGNGAQQADFSQQTNAQTLPTGVLSALLGIQGAPSPTQMQQLQGGASGVSSMAQPNQQNANAQTLQGLFNLASMVQPASGSGS